MSGITPTDSEAHRMVCFQLEGKEKRMRIFPLAGDTDKFGDNDATGTYDHEEQAEEAPSAGPPVASSAQIPEDACLVVL